MSDFTSSIGFGQNGGNLQRFNLPPRNNWTTLIGTIQLTKNQLFMEDYFKLIIILLIGLVFLISYWCGKTSAQSERIDKLRKDIKEMSETVQRMDDIMNKKEK